jgi:hypothetical protein
MSRRIRMFFLSKPNFNEYACKFMVLNLNKIQDCFRFEFPEMSSYPLSSVEQHQTSNYFGEFSRIIKSNFPDSAKDDYFIGLTTLGLDSNKFWDKKENMAIITTDSWDRLFTPPSVLEYIIHSIAGSLVQMMSEHEGSQPILSHKETKGCLLDYTYFKEDDKVDISIGDVCDECRLQIVRSLGEEFVSCIGKMASGKWIGEVDSADSVAHGLKKYFKIDLNKDTGFNKTFFEKAKDSFPELPKDIILVLITAGITYIVTRLSSA